MEHLGQWEEGGLKGCRGEGRGISQKGWLHRGVSSQGCSGTLGQVRCRVRVAMWTNGRLTAGGCLLLSTPAVLIAQGSACWGPRPP